MGFDTFTSKECMNISQYTPNGNWPTDDVLVQETVKAMNATENQSDFVYTITVEGHGDYPTEKLLENPDILVSGAADEASNNQWEYYVNMIHEVDDFIGDLITAVDRRGEDTIIVFFGDHLPTMGLTDADMKSGDIFKTKYITWNNMGLAKKDADLTAYQLLAHITDQAGIHEGTMFRYHQTQTASETYLSGLEETLHLRRRGPLPCIRPCDGCGGRYRLLCPQEYKQQYLDGVRCELYQEYEDFCKRQ